MCAGVLAAVLCAVPPLHAAAREIDGFERPSDWRAVPADGVSMHLASAPGVRGRALRVEFRFEHGAGYAVIHRDVGFDLPDNYRLRLRVRGECPSENLELKLIDSTGANVWWCNRRGYAFPRTWTTVDTRTRQISFAWGPAGGGTIHRVAAVELAVTAGSGGSGSVWFDALELEPLPPEGAWPPRVTASASSSSPGAKAPSAVDGDTSRAWRSGVGDRAPWLALDLGASYALGGMVVDWGARPARYVIEADPGDGTWRRVREVAGSRRRDWLQLPDLDARRVRLRALAVPPRGMAVREVAVEPSTWAPTRAALIDSIARTAPRGRYPRAFVGEQPFWTVVGVEGAHDRALMSEDGAIEPFTGGWSVEPFLIAGGRLVTWAGVLAEQSRLGGMLPLPRVTWRAGALNLEITARAEGGRDTSRAVVTYRLGNAAARDTLVRLALAVRPLQVNPESQSLGTPTGAAVIGRLDAAGGTVRVNGRPSLRVAPPPDGWGAIAFGDGDVSDFLARGALPPARPVVDPHGLASGALAWDLHVPAGGRVVVTVEMPIEPGAAWRTLATRSGIERGTLSEDERAAQLAWWSRFGDARLHMPADVMAAAQAQLGHILALRSGDALQPGARTYARSWIRDGAFMANALLRMGRADAAKDYLRWFAAHQYPNGKVPCCVDARGSDPVPEHDSEGEFVWLAAEVVRLARDTTAAREVWPAVLRAVDYLDALRDENARTTPPESLAFQGLLPPSISHEGYSARPMHSYWDDLFALRGYRDAAWLAGTLGLPVERERLAARASAFAAAFGASVRASMAAHHIDYVPGCADLGDFDATSTTLALDPVQAEALLPGGALERTFERYWTFARDRATGVRPWADYTPYEARAVGAFVRLGWRDRADSLLTWLMLGRRPAGWQQWPEVVTATPRAPHFLGDLPHAWVAADVLRSIVTMLAYERERDDALVLAAGVPAHWLDAGPVGVEQLHTRWGELEYWMTRGMEGFDIQVSALSAPPAGGVVIAAPDVTPRWRATVNGAAVPIAPDGTVTIHTLPARVRITLSM